MTAPNVAITIRVDRAAPGLVAEHGRSDHVGGLPHLLKTTPQEHVYGHPAGVQPADAHVKTAPDLPL
jgi:metal-dependent hydrolase (beta-lactamase superfamily II)